MDDFEISCRGAIITEKAKDAVKSLQKGKRVRDQLRDEVRTLIVASVRKYPLPKPVVRD